MLTKKGAFKVETSSTLSQSVMPRAVYCFFRLAASAATAAAAGSEPSELTIRCRSSCCFANMACSAATSSPPPPPPPLFFISSTMALYFSSSIINLRSAGDMAAEAFFGASCTTLAFFAKLSVANVYFRYVTSGRMAQKRYVFELSIMSFKYLQRKYVLQPGMETPGLSFFALKASAIFMKNCAISESERLIFLPWSCSSLVRFWSWCGPKSFCSMVPSLIVTAW
mmetsp:Transcript_25426/g.85438  ORF Transcript_25426/g.85438 Transcript_25426/m.85438 type:complete len:225 (+) Transcript_25426:1567-2241(+)